MKKVSVTFSDKLILKFILKSVLLTVLSVISLSLVFSEILLKLDISTEYADIISVVICFVSSAAVSLISLGGFKNNGLIIGVISQLPLLLLILYNCIFNNNSLLLLALKAAVIIITGSVCGYLRVKKNNTFKV